MFIASCALLQKEAEHSKLFLKKFSNIFCSCSYYSFMMETNLCKERRLARKCKSGMNFEFASHLKIESSSSCYSSI